MGDRLRCADCTGHVAYECDKLLDEATALYLLDEVLDERPAREFHHKDGQVTFTEHAPSTPYAIDKAAERRRFQSTKLAAELTEELDCELTPDEVQIALYGTVLEARKEKGEEVEQFKQSMGEAFDKFISDIGDK